MVDAQPLGFESECTAAVAASREGICDGVEYMTASGHLPIMYIDNVRYCRQQWTAAIHEKTQQLPDPKPWLLTSFSPSAARRNSA